MAHQQFPAEREYEAQTNGLYSEKSIKKWYPEEVWKFILSHFIVVVRFLFVPLLDDFISVQVPLMGLDFFGLIRLNLHYPIRCHNCYW